MPDEKKSSSQKSTVQKKPEKPIRPSGRRVVEGEMKNRFQSKDNEN